MAAFWGYCAADLVDEKRGIMIPLVVFYPIRGMGKSERVGQNGCLALALSPKDAYFP